MVIILIYDQETKVYLLKFSQNKTKQQQRTHTS